MNIKAFMEEMNLKYHAKAIGIGFGYIAVGIAFLCAMTIIVKNIVEMYGIQSIPLIIMSGVIILFAWLFGDMHMVKKGWKNDNV